MILPNVTLPLFLPFLNLTFTLRYKLPSSNTNLLGFTIFLTTEPNVIKLFTSGIYKVAHPNKKLVIYICKIVISDLSSSNFVHLLYPYLFNAPKRVLLMFITGRPFNPSLTCLREYLSGAPIYGSSWP
jgi:hypothetical protein